MNSGYKMHNSETGTVQYVCVYFSENICQHVVTVCSVETLQHLCSSLFSSQYSEPVSNFLLPAIARDTRFPFVRLLHCLLPTHVADSVGAGVGDVGSDWCLAVEPSIWLLHSTLTLATPHLGLLLYDVFTRVISSFLL